MITNKQRELLLNQLKKTPIIQIACEKTGISRATFYRWCRKNKKFKEQAEEAISEGSKLVNDMAESQLISAIREQNLTAIIFWLKTHHPQYKQKIELSGKIGTIDETFTPELQKQVLQSLKMAGLKEKNKNLTKKNHEK